MKQKINIAVRDLVEFSMSAGDLEFAGNGFITPMEAIRAHQRVQRSRPDGYLSEVPVSRTFQTAEFDLVVGGRIDGLLDTGDEVTVEEIKTTTRSLEAMEEADHPLHWGQAKCYACFYAMGNDLDEVTVQLTYCHIPSGEIREIRRFFQREELEGFVTEAIKKYLEWARVLTDWENTRDGSITGLDFPFQKYRPGQREMAGAVYRAIRDEDRLFVEAPTGIGKTMAVLFPAVKALPEALTSKIFYLTARTTGKGVAEDALNLMRNKGLKLKSLTLTAKDKICFNPDGECTGEECEYAKGHYDRLPNARREAFLRDDLSRQTVEDLAEKHKVCPYEFSLDLSLWADCVVGDYNYAFDPRVYLRRFFEGAGGDYTFLVDEAHNLVDRAREMFSAELTKGAVLELRRKAGQEVPGVYRALTGVNSWMLAARKACDPEKTLHARREKPEDLLPLLKKFTSEAERWLVRNLPAPFREDLLELYFRSSVFLKTAEAWDDGYAACFEPLGRDLRVRLFCLDPSGRMGEALERCRAAVFFSGTLSPALYFRRLLGCGDSGNDLVLPSPFPPENLCLLVLGRVSTLYRQRDRTGPEVSGALRRLARAKKGNYLFYFPSYEYLSMVHGLFTLENPGADVLVQDRGMTEGERGSFLERFSHDNPGTLTGFAVMGGFFGEAIDLTGDRLAGAAVVGVGLPSISPERDLIREHFDRAGGAGFEFAYLYPGINRVLQAAGRVIRSESDRGVVLLIDSRFATSRYRSFFPRGWRPQPIQNGDHLDEKLKKFWEGRGP